MEGFIFEVSAYQKSESKRGGICNRWIGKEVLVFASSLEDANFKVVEYYQKIPDSEISSIRLMFRASELEASVVYSVDNLEYNKFLQKETINEQV